MKQRNRVAGVLTICLAVFTWLNASVMAADDAPASLAAKIAQLRKAGEPILPEDFNQKPVPDDENAVILLRAAAKSINTDSEAWKKLDEQNLVLPLTDEQLNLVQQVMAEDTKALEQVAAAQLKTGVDWQVKWESPTINVPLPDLNWQRNLATFLSYAALARHQTGDDRGAVACIRQIMFLANTTDGQPAIVAHLVSIGIGLVAANTARQVAVDLKIGDDPKSAQSDQLRSSIEMLLDVQPSREGLIQALRGERMMEIETLSAIQHAKIAPKLLQAALAKKPASDLPEPTEAILATDALLLLDRTGALLEAVSKSHDWQTFYSSPEEIVAERKPDYEKNPYAAILAPVLERAVLADYRALTQRRLIATQLALRWYASDHQDKNPASLEDLVPKYMPEVPKDPFAKNAKMRYTLANRPRIYSVGENYQDDAGDDKPTRGKDPWSAPDFVIFLERE